jgi:MoaA/NifB/PqqE/SkfB family radical SAM enzyme
MDKCLEKMSFYKQKYPNLNYLISISAESVGQNFEYIRYGCSYDRFVENFKKWANTGYLMSTNMAINPISITMLPDYFNFLIYITMKYKIKIDVKANIVYTPGITVGFLDDRFKKYVKRSIKIVNKFRNRFDNYEEIIENLQVVYNTIGSDITLRRIKQFSEAIEYFSKVRKLSLKDVNPLLQDYINEKLKYYEYYEE